VKAAGNQDSEMFAMTCKKMGEALVPMALAKALPNGDEKAKKNFEDTFMSNFVPNCIKGANSPKGTDEHSGTLNMLGKAVNDVAGKVVDKVQKLVGVEPEIPCDQFDSKRMEAVAFLQQHQFEIGTGMKGGATCEFIDKLERLSEAGQRCGLGGLPGPMKDMAVNQARREGGCGWHG
jgi:hypothetical protein